MTALHFEKAKVLYLKLILLGSAVLICMWTVNSINNKSDSPDQNQSQLRGILENRLDNIIDVRTSAVNKKSEPVADLLPMYQGKIRIVNFIRLWVKVVFLTVSCHSIYKRLSREKRSGVIGIVKFMGKCTEVDHLLPENTQEQGLTFLSLFLLANYLIALV